MVTLTHQHLKNKNLLQSCIQSLLPFSQKAVFLSLCCSTNEQAHTLLSELALTSRFDQQKLSSLPFKFSTADFLKLKKRWIIACDWYILSHSETSLWTHGILCILFEILLICLYFQPVLIDVLGCDVQISRIYINVQWLGMTEIRVCVGIHLHRKKGEKRESILPTHTHKW